MMGMGILIPTFPMLIAPHALHRIIPSTWTVAQGFILGGWLLATFPIMQFFFSPLLGQLADRYGRRRVLALSLAGTSVSYVLFAIGIITHNIPLLFFSRMVDGATGGNISVAQAVIGDVSSPEHRARNFGLVGVALGLGFILGPFLGGVLSDPSLVPWFHITTPFYFAALLALINVLLVLWLLPETLQHVNPEPIQWKRPLANIAQVFRVPELRSTIPAIFLFNSGFTFFTTFWGVVLAEDFGFSQGHIGNFFGFMGIMVVLSQGGLVRRLSGKVQDYRVLRFSIFATGFCLVPYYFIPGDKPLWIYAIPPFLAIAMALTKSFSGALLTRITRPQIRGEVMGINSSANALAQVLPAILAGYLAAEHARLPILVGSITVLAGGVVFWKGINRLLNNPIP
jgi:DHA1 family tetracycline resistance protein-like MFS transporter